MEEEAERPDPLRSPQQNTEQEPLNVFEELVKLFEKCKTDVIKELRSDQMLQHAPKLKVLAQDMSITRGMREELGSLTADLLKHGLLEVRFTSRKMKRIIILSKFEHCSSCRKCTQARERLVWTPRCETL